MPDLLILEDEAVLARNLIKAFERQGLDVTHVATVAAARAAVAEHVPDVALLDLRLPDGSGIDVLREVAERDPEVPVVMMTAYGSVADAVEAMRLGARDYVQKPLDLDEIRLKIQRAVGQANQRREVTYYRRRDAALELLGDSEAMRRLRAVLERLAAASGAAGAEAPTVLLLGETGVGKSHAARILHAAGARAQGPFIEVNCTALPATLIEDELFGHERGAFTDARTARAGLFETASGGVIFLDEIGHLDLSLQAKFLRVLEDKTIRRIGGTQQRRVDTQVVVATNRDLEAAVRAGEFREDLYQRLRVAEVRVPPLRERSGDVVPLAREFLARAASRYRAAARQLTGDAEAALTAYGWPGNVRELANTMERVVLFSDANPVAVEDLGLPDAPAEAPRVAVAATGEVTIDFPPGGIALEAVERHLLQTALERADGNQSAAARLLGISRDTLRYRMEKFGL